MNYSFMNATISTTLEIPVSPEEQKTFEANARIAGRKPGDHLRAILFPARPVPKQAVSKIGAKKAKKRSTPVHA